MNKQSLRTGIVALIGLSLALAAQASAGTVTVQSSDVIYAAGTQGSVANGTGGTVPTGIINLSNSASTITFSSVTGSLACTASAQGCVTLNGYGNLNDADGNGAGTSSSTVNGAGSISGVAGPNAGYLVGVFIASNGPTGAAPASLDFTANGLGTSFTSLSPLLDQVFFIGDGLTGDGTGTRQIFNAPAGAGYLYLGLSDAGGYNGAPGAYQDNAGIFQVVVTPLAQDLRVLEIIGSVVGVVIVLLGVVLLILRPKPVAS